MKRLIAFLIVIPVLFFLQCKKDFSRRPQVTTGTFDLPNAVAHGTLVDRGTKEITDHGFCWDSMGNPSLANQSVKLGGLAAAGSFQAQLTTLRTGKTYSLRAFISFEEEVLYGAIITFTTPDLPDLTTAAVSEVTESYAKCGGEILSDNGSPILSRGVCWGFSANPDTTGSHTVDGTGTGIFQSVLSGLSANTQYFVRAYATTIYGTGYGNEIVFNTGQSASTPLIATKDVTGITQTTATSGGNVVSDGGSAVVQRGVCWSTVPYPTTSGNKTEDGPGTGVFTSSVTGLMANTTYYLRAYATNEIGTSYGNEISFTTEQAPVLPTVITSAVTNITDTSATSGGTVTADGGSPVTARGVCWSTSANPTTIDPHTTDGSGLGILTSSVTGLSAGTKCYLRAYASNGAGTAYGNEISFTAGQSVTTPAVTTDALYNITQTTATGGGNVTADGGAPVTARGVCWSTSANPTTADPHTTDGSGPGVFTSNLTGLTANTQYCVRAYATNSAGTSYGNERVFTTLPEVTVPSVTTAPVTNITPNTATSGGTVTASGGAPVTARGVCWSTGPNPTTANSHTSNGTGTGSFVSQLTGLTDGTQYNVRAYATNSAGTAYGNQQVFSTLAEPVLPTVTTAPVTDITQTTATSGGTVYSDGGAPVTARGVCWSTSPNPTTGNSHTTDGSGTGTFISYLTGLSPNTTYYVRAYATNSVGTAYGNQEVFTTLQTVTLPTVTTDPATSITQTTATSGGNVTSAGGGTVTARGVCWATTPSPTLANSYTVDGSGTGTFISNLTGLTPGTLYYLRAYATNSAGTGYGNEVTFTTLSNLPSVTTTDASGITATAATTGGNVTGDGGSPVTARGVCYNTAPNPTLANSYTANGSGLGIFTSNLTALTPSTLYYLRAYATNSNGTAYGNEIGFTTLSTLPTVTTTAASNITATTAKSGGNVTSDGGAIVTARGVCWNNATNPTLANYFTTDGSGTGVFISNLTGLSPSTLYYLRAYATNSNGTAYGNEISFSTLWGCGAPITYSFQTYNTIQIGSQCWLKENLNIGIRINAPSPQGNNAIIEKWCYDNVDEKCNIWGGLYQWAEAVQYLNGATNYSSWNPIPSGNVQGICPSGWHIPKQDEWDLLITFLGGEDVSGGKMKETGFSHWDPPNTGATNGSGFTGFGSGRHGGFFMLIAQMTWFWEATEYSSSVGWHRVLLYTSDDCQRTYSDKIVGNSVRCVKD